MTLHVAQIVNTEDLQHDIHRNMVCFKYVIVNTLHKGDNKDDDDDNNNIACRILGLETCSSLINSWQVFWEVVFSFVSQLNNK